MNQWTIVTKWLLLLLLVLARFDQQVFRFVINQFQPQCNAYKINRAHCVRNQQPCRLVFIIKMFKFTRQRRNIDGGNMYLNLNPTTSTPHRILWHRIEGRENNSRYQKPQHPTSAVQGNFALYGCRSSWACVLYLWTFVKCLPTLWK